MASSSSYSSRRYMYDVFPSFCGQDVRQNFLSHFIGEFKREGISTFIDNGIIRSESISSELVKAIKKSRIAVVILSKNYASSSWCLNELLLIMECWFKLELTVMPIFYGVDPSDVRKQTGDFGKGFKETCDGKTKEEKRRWKEALTQVADIAGEHSVLWDSEAGMIWKIVMDVSNELPSSDFDRLVGIEAHVENIKSMMCLQSDKVKILGICGPAGIGKTTIARALYKQVSCNFQLKYYMEHVDGEFCEKQLDKLQYLLEEKLLSEILDHRDRKIVDLKEAQSRLQHQRVLLILDDFCFDELKFLLNLVTSFRFGSKVIVMTDDAYRLAANGINQIYKVSFPSREEPLQIFSYSAFGQKSPPRSYLKQANEFANFVAPFPLSLKILGSSLRGKTKGEWMDELPKLEAYFGKDYYWLMTENRDVRKVIEYAYDGLSHRQRYRLHELASSMHHRGDVNMSSTFLESAWDVEEDIQTLSDMALISKSEDGGIMVHSLVRLLIKRVSENAPSLLKFY